MLRPCWTLGDALLQPDPLQAGDFDLFFDSCHVQYSMRKMLARSVCFDYSKRNGVSYCSMLLEQLRFAVAGYR